MAKIPNPGSEEAQEKDCTCPVMDNHYGVGIPGPDGKNIFWMNEECPLHGWHNKNDKPGLPYKLKEIKNE